MTENEKEKRIRSHKWFHSINIDGIITPGSITNDVLKQLLEYLRFPSRLDGLTVLDVGAWDGFFSFEAERRGAARVVAYDLHPPDYYGFSLAKELLGSGVEYQQGNVYDISQHMGTFDVVLFRGVFYHLRYPLLALDRLWEVTGQYMLIESQAMDSALVLDDGCRIPLADIDPRLTAVPLYRFYRRDELNPGDYSNWFSPNSKALEESLRSAGFKPEFLSTWGDRICYKANKLPGIQEYKIQTYEGMQYITDQSNKQVQVLLKYPRDIHE